MIDNTPLNMFNVFSPLLGLNLGIPRTEKTAPAHSQP